MTTTPHQPAMPHQPVIPAQPYRAPDPTTAIPVQRAGAPMPQPPAPAAPKGRRRWPFAVGGLVVGLVIGLSMHGGTATAPASASAAAPAAPSAPAPAGPVVPTAPAAPAAPVAPAAPAAPAGPLTSFSDGTYEVGTDIAAGKYKTPGPSSSGILDSCYMEVGDGSGDVEGIDKNDNLTGPGVVTLKAGKVFTVKNGCTWTKVA